MTAKNSPSNSLSSRVREKGCKTYLKLLHHGLFLLLVPVHSFAGGAWLGGLAGAANSLNESIREQQVEDRQRRLLEYQYELENRRQQKIREESELRTKQSQDRQRKQKAESDQAERSRGSTGTGFVVTTDGYLITNYHVVVDKTNVAVRDIKGRFFKAQIAAVDQRNDLALLKIEGNFSALKIGNSSLVTKGQRIFAVGFPQISIQGGESKITDGIISSFSGIKNNPNWFQISAPIQGGNSGGPLVTEDGAVVGVIVATANPSQFFNTTGNLPQNVNYAIKASVVQSFLTANQVSYTVASRVKTSLPAVDNGTFLIIAKNSDIGVNYYVSPEVSVQIERARERANLEDAKKRNAEEKAEKLKLAADAASLAKLKKEEILAGAKRDADERLAEKKRALELNRVEKRDAELKKAYPEWEGIQNTASFWSWIREQPLENKTIRESNNPSDVVRIVKKYQNFLLASAATNREGNQKIGSNVNDPNLVENKNLPTPIASTKELVGKVIEVNSQFGFAVALVTARIPANTRIVVAGDGKVFEGRAEKQSGTTISLTLDGNELPASLVGNSVYVRR